ncbi:MAG: four helix bundle protein [Bacteroidales bacterium]|nr:four helix bundle protein [Bacteroidales bacterium]
MRKEMENRLINFAVDLFEMSKDLSNSFVATHLANQILRSSTGAALNFAEALSAESRKDFIHKTSIVLKELRESNVNLRIISRMKICKDEIRIDNAIRESEELVSIFYRSIETAKKNATEVTKGR